MEFNDPRMVSIIYYKCMQHLIVHFNPGAIWLFSETPFLSLLLNTLTEIPLAISSIDA
jgi:hypothetical protein